MRSQPSFLPRRVRPFLAEESAVSAAEYAILLAMIVVGSMAIIQSVGQSFRGIYLAIAEKIPQA